MQQAKVNVLFSFFPYGGNGGISSEHPSIRSWFAKTGIEAKADDRIDRVEFKDFSDTPITMTRNAAVQHARQCGCDFIVMVDSDQHPDSELDEDIQAKPFWKTSFDFAYDRLMRGKLTVVGAPYCGPPPDECVYVFKWTTMQSDIPTPNFSMQMYSREDAAQRGGMEQVAALPTGLILFDMKVFDTVEPPYFYYEYTDEFRSKKASTEDVTATRDISLHAILHGQENPIFCNWDAWAGHWKPKCVRKPRVIFAENISDKYKKAVLLNHKRGEQMVQVGGSSPILEVGPVAKKSCLNGKIEPSTKAELHSRLANHDVVLEPK